jgi:DNA-binding Lrp family transcriptional regulator
MLDELDKKIVAKMQDEFPLVPEPYKELADQLGIHEDELLARLRRYHRCGHIRKMGLVLRHREVGYKANALCACLVPEERLEQVGKQMAVCASVTHCYTRIPRPEWNYNFYIMLHAPTREECCRIAAQLAEDAAISDYVMLFSVREWKKTSMRYFSEHKPVK